ncbi:UV damage repair endonuclease [Pontibacillus halophilus JSM 076056 = DSM 19796]|uniref:UV damage repair endonuclease n=1 Tax=Pontibacillus halophilus JSM 076056 = DSM 19796 TaxID=1385510 RepID=A0A0A5GJ51_9BACI|nr:UV DNA damage repair endonuclease UvsE [Pontibacillus halophilus]KGX91994.1 UV damage repair endonuclease [Pontibacillus halophilus JSM 076056 = DSM 19796]
MTLYRFGYVAMSNELSNASPNQTMTYAQFSKLEDREAAIHKLERIAKSNLHNCLRLLRHNRANEVDFFRLSSRLVPLATHEELKGWNYIQPIKEELLELGSYAQEHGMRIDFHPDHFVVLNTKEEKKFKASLTVLQYHYRLLKGMGIDPTHRCVLHLGGMKESKEASLEQFISNWAHVPRGLQQMIMLENDDKLYNVEDLLYVCEKVNIPLVFDLHHHKANEGSIAWTENWNRIVNTWSHSPLPIKIHLSSPKSQEEYRSHADFVDLSMVDEFTKHTAGTADVIHCMLEAKQKDNALFKLCDELATHEDYEQQSRANFIRLPSHHSTS